MLRPTLLSAAVLSVLLTACASSPPNAALTPGLHPEQRWSQPSDNTGPTARWDLFQDAELDQWLVKASGNRDVELAARRLSQARRLSTISATRGEPSLDLTARLSQSETTQPDAIKQRSPDTRALNLGVELSWELDLSGRLAAAQHAADADAEAAQALLEATRLSTEGQIVQTWLAWHAAHSRRQHLLAALDASHGLERLMKARVQAGVATAADLARTVADSARLQTRLPELDTQQALAELRLGVLMGMPAGTRVAPTVPVAGTSVPTAPVFSAGQPIDLLRRRPDLRAAESRWRAESRRTEEAAAALWPRLVLGAALGSQDLRLNALDLAPAVFRQFALAFTLPLLNSGRLQEQLALQRDRADEATISYAQAVARAVEEVDGLLQQRHDAARQRESLEQAVQATGQRLALAQRLRSAGQTDATAALELERAHRELQAELAGLQQQERILAARLILALGGNWAASPDSSMRPTP